jgi:hypothetical protein
MTTLTQVFHRLNVKNVLLSNVTGERTVNLIMLEEQRRRQRAKQRVLNRIKKAIH